MVIEMFNVYSLHKIHQEVTKRKKRSKNEIIVFCENSPRPWKWFSNTKPEVQIYLPILSHRTLYNSPTILSAKSLEESSLS